MNTSQIKSSTIAKPMVSILKNLLGFIGIYIISGIVAEICIIITFTCVGIDIMGGKMPNNIFTQAAPLYGFIFFTLGTIIYCKFIGKLSIKALGFHKKGAFLNYLKGFFIGILILSTIVLISLAAGALTYHDINNKISASYIIIFLIGYCIQGMAEEVMCRGYLMTSLSTKISMPWAIFISSLVFTFPHLQALMKSDFIFNCIGFSNTMLFSIFISLIMVKYKNIWLVSAIHSSWNFALGILCGISVSGGNVNNSVLSFSANEFKSIINGGKYGLEAGIVTTTIMMICIIMQLILIKRRDT